MIYNFLRFLVKGLFKVLYKIDVRGIENIPQENSLIIATNHCSYLDPIILFLTVPRHIRWIVMRELYKVPWLKIILWALRCIPVNGSVDKAVEWLKKGGVIGIFPEGSRSLDGKLKEAKTGCAALALIAGRPILPISIRGTFRAYPPGVIFPKFSLPIWVNIGKPVQVCQRQETEISEKEKEEITKRLMDEIKILYDESL